MAFVPHGKKATQKRAGQVRREIDERAIAKVVQRAQFAVRHAPRQSLPLCVLLQRVLLQTVPGRAFALRLGSLKVAPRRGLADPIAFDPRPSDGTAPHPGPLPAGTACHAWLETPAGLLLDPSIFLTLVAEGYAVDREDYFLADGREHVRGDLGFHYEEQPRLELVGVAESEAYLERAMSLVQKGFPLELGPNVLGVVWRAAGA